MTPIRWKRFAAVALGFTVLLGVAHLPALRGEVVAGVDAFQLAIPDTTFLLDSLHRGEWPLWTPYERLGQPFAAQLQTQVFYPVRWIAALVFGPIWGVEWELLFHSALACLGCYFACRALGRSRLASFLGGASFGVGPLYVELAHIPNMTGAAGWSGLMLAAACHLDKQRSWRAGALLTLCATGSLLNGSPETWLWQGLLLFIVTGRGWRVKKLLRKAIALGASFAVAAVTVIPTLEFLKESVRATRVPDQFLWSSPPATLLGLFWLNADLPRFDSDQPLLGCVFLGTCVWVLALIGLRPRGATRRVLALAGVLALLSLGNRFWLSHLALRVPPFSLFRYPVKYLVGVAFCFSLGAARGLDVLRAWAHRMPTPLGWKRALAGLGVVLAIAAVALAARQVLPLRAGAGTGLVWGSLVGLVGLGLVLAPGRSRRSTRIALSVALLALVEQAAVWTLWSGRIWVPAKELARSSWRKDSLPRPWESRIQVDVSNEERAARWPIAESFVVHSRDNLIPLRNVEEQVALADGYGPPEPARWSVATHRVERGFMDLAGVTQYFTPERPPFPDLLAEANPPEPGLLRRFTSQTAFPRAFIVYRAQVASDEEALKALADPNQPLRTRAVLADGEAIDSHPACAILPPAWVAYQPRFLALDAEVCADAYLVVTDSDFPGWEAWVDDKPTPIRRADYLVRAIPLAAGRHRIEMRYRPNSIRWGAALSGLSLLGVAVALLRRGRSANRVYR